MIGWVSFGGDIPSLPDNTVAELMEHWEAVNRQGGLWRRFRPGEKVRVVSHSLEGLAEVVKEAKSPHSRVQVLLQFMGSLVRAHVPWENLQPIEDRLEEKPRPPRRTRGRGRWVRGFEPLAGAAAHS